MLNVIYDARSVSNKTIIWGHFYLMSMTIFINFRLQLKSPQLCNTLSLLD